MILDWLIRTLLFVLSVIGMIILAIWLIIVRLVDLGGDIRDYLARRNKSCDKTPAKRRPRRAF